ncbi:hypothetical protein DSL72_002137 [Monilinia vaccinii-corymbosi]|uniref:Alcohol dehydrogenase iron-type/glycerol dehydrogenase GldA domain-containing protein n=1 Tax=Monilinia vaccinii-corymbosi TaxID=61207 RepID=A0A8A3PBT9_9HELO|nr:hypothetical protein DSL72_002137 [Monilinia vaccinii-corymbosi]
MAASKEIYTPAFPSKSKPHISTGIPFQEACAHHIKNTFHASRPYIIVSNSISKTFNFSSLQKRLGDQVVGVRYGIKPHTPWDDVLEVIHDMRVKEADIIVTLGAGSLTDGAKLVSFALANNVSSHDELYSLSPEAQTPNPKPCQIPIINIPTSLSGGEYSSTAGATNTLTHQKVSFSHPSMSTSLVILSPSLCISTPQHIWLSTGLRAVDHCVEGLCSLDEKVCAESDEEFSEGLRLLVSNLLITKKDPTNEDARLKEMWGVLEAMKGLIRGIPMGGSHGIGSQLGPLGVGHGETSCIMLPPVLKYNAKHGNQDEKVIAGQRKVLKVLWGEAAIKEVLEKRGLKKEHSDASDAVGAIVSELDMPRTLKDVGVGKAKLNALADNCLKHRWLSTNAVPLTTKKQVLEILEMTAGS